MIERCEYCRELYDNRLPCDCLGTEAAKDAATWKKSFRQAQERADENEAEVKNLRFALAEVMHDREAEQVCRRQAQRERDEALAEVRRMRAVAKDVRYYIGTTEYYIAARLLDSIFPGEDEVAEP